MKHTRGKLLLLAYLTESTALIIALLAAWVFDITLLTISKNPLRDILIGTFAALLPLALFIILLSEKAGKLVIIHSLRRTLLTDIKALFHDARLGDIVTISLFAGIAEEMLFRGILQVKFGVIISSILFGIVHFVTPAYVIIAFIMGLYIGILFHVFESLLVPIQLHFIYDLGALIYLKYFTPSDIKTSA